MNLISSSSHPPKWPLPLYERVCITFPPLKLPWHLRTCVSVQTAIFICKTELAFLGQRIKYQFCYCLALFFKFFIFFALSCADFLSLDLSWKLLGGRDCPIPALPPFPICTPLLLLPRLFQRSAISQANVGCLKIVLGTKVSSPQSKHVDSSILASAFHHSLLAPVLCNQFLQNSLWNWELPPILSVCMYRGLLGCVIIVHSSFHPLIRIF